MTTVLRHVLPAAFGVLLLTGCTTDVVTGQASPGPGEPVDVSADEFPITGVSEEPIDQFARNALANLNSFWSDAYPEFFDDDFTPLELHGGGMLRKQIRLQGYTLGPMLADSSRRARAVAAVAEHLERRDFAPVIDSYFPLDAVQDAHRRLEDQAPLVALAIGRRLGGRALALGRALAATVCNRLLGDRLRHDLARAGAR